MVYEFIRSGQCPLTAIGMARISGSLDRSHHNEGQHDYIHDVVQELIVMEFERD
jgi:hypothetical protein